MTLQLNNRVYDTLKWLCMIVLPASAVLYSSLAGVWGWPYEQEVSTTINAIVVFIGALIKVSTDAYNREAANGNRE